MALPSREELYEYTDGAGVPSSDMEADVPVLVAAEPVCVVALRMLMASSSMITLMLGDSSRDGSEHSELLLRLRRGICWLAARMAAVEDEMMEEKERTERSGRGS